MLDRNGEGVFSVHMHVDSFLKGFTVFYFSGAYHHSIWTLVPCSTAVLSFFPCEELTTSNPSTNHRAVNEQQAACLFPFM
jgi:hypothetical protein